MGTTLKKSNDAKDVYFNEIYNKMMLSDLSTRARNILKRHFPTYTSFLELEIDSSKIENIKSCGVKTKEEIITFLSAFKDKTSELSTNTETEKSLADITIQQRYSFLSEDERSFVRSFKEQEKHLPALFITIRFLETTDDRDLQIWSSGWGIEFPKSSWKSLSRERIRQIVQKVSGNIQKVIGSIIDEEEWDEYGLEYFFSFSDNTINIIFEKEFVKNKYLAFYLLSIATKSNLFAFSREGEQLDINTVRDKSKYRLHLDNIEDNSPSYLYKRSRPYLFAFSNIYSNFNLSLYIYKVFDAVIGKLDFDVSSPLNGIIYSNVYWSSNTSKDKIVNYKYERTELYRALKTIAIEIGGDIIVNGKICCKANVINYSRFVYETLLEEDERLSTYKLYTIFLSRYLDKQISRESFSAKIRKLDNVGESIVDIWKLDYFSDDLSHINDIDSLKELPLFEIVKIYTPNGNFFNLYALRSWNNSIVNYISYYVSHNSGWLNDLANHLILSHFPIFDDNDIVYYLAVCHQRGILNIDIESVFKRKWDNLWFNKCGIYEQENVISYSPLKKTKSQIVSFADDIKREKDKLVHNNDLRCPLCESNDIGLWNSRKQTYHCHSCNCYFDKYGMIKGMRCPVCCSTDIGLWNLRKQTYHCHVCDCYFNKYGRKV